jgi:hypothetical protein
LATTSRISNRSSKIACRFTARPCGRGAKWSARARA